MEIKEDLVMIPHRASGPAGGSVIRIERLPHNADNYRTAHHVAEGPFKGIVINRAATELEDVGHPDLSLTFDVSMTNKQHKINPEYKERRNVHFWFKPDKGDAEMGREYMRQLLKPEGFPKDYVSFIKKALVLTQQFPALLRVDLVLGPRGASPGGEGVHSTHEDWLKTTEEERAARMQVAQTRRTQEEQAARTTHVQKLSNVALQPEVSQGDQPIQNFITVMTPAVYDYQYLPEVPVSNKSRVSFRVRAQSNAHVALSAVYGDTERKTYEVVIGSDLNRKSVVRMGGEGPVMAEASTLGVLDGDDFRAFWISWNQAKIKVGREEGERPFLVWDIPAQKVHGVNCIAVSTAAGAEGQWEFVEEIYARNTEEETREQKRARFRASLMWLAKKQKMVQVLEDAYPNSVNTPDLLRLCAIGLRDMMTAVVMLKEFEKRGLITEVVRGVWLRSPSGAPGDQHVIKVVENLPVMRGRDIPTIAIVTSLYCEKLAVDAMMEHKVSYVKYKTEEESHVYTVGRIGQHMCVSTKLSRSTGSRGSVIAAGNSITRLLGLFEAVAHVVLVGTGGAVPDYQDYTRHVRLGDVVVSTPPALTPSPRRRAQHQGEYTYIHCNSFTHDASTNKSDFETRSFQPGDTTIQKCVMALKELSERGGATPAWQRHIQEGLTTLNAEESSFSRPATKKDKLFAWIEGKSVQVEHPRAPVAFLPSDGVTRVRFGAVGSGRYVARNEALRYEFGRRYGVMAFDADDAATCIDAIHGSRKESYVVIRGAADYLDGSRSKEWQPYAALAAAGVMKALLGVMPTTTYSHRR